MKKSKFIKEDSNLTLQEKKEKIQLGLKKLTELGTVDPKNRYQELINDIARVLYLGTVMAAMVKAVSKACQTYIQFMGKSVSFPLKTRF